MNLKDTLDDLKYNRKVYPYYEKASSAWFEFKYFSYWPHNIWKTHQYRKKVVRRGYSDWVIDEMDSSFNEMMATSLRYHTHTMKDGTEGAITQLHPNIEAEALRLIPILEEYEPSFTDEELKRLNEIHEEQGDRDLLASVNRLSTPEEEAIRDTYWKRKEEWRERELQARIDLMKILKHLWS